MRGSKIQDPRFIQKDTGSPYLLLLASCILFMCFAVLPGILEAQTSDGMVDIRDAIAIVSTAMGVKIVVDGDIKGRVPLELDNASPRQIRDRLEKALKEAGFSWVSEGGVVRIIKNGRRTWASILGKRLPLSYYMEIIARNNLFLPLGGVKKEVQPEFVLKGVFSIRDNRRAIIEVPSANKGYYVSKGESIGNSMVIEIAEDQVVLMGPNGQVTLKIQSSTPSK